MKASFGPCAKKYLKGTAAMFDPYDVDSDGDNPEVAITEWTWGKAPVSFPWVKELENALTSISRRLIRSLTCCWKRSS